MKSLWSLVLAAGWLSLATPAMAAEVNLVFTDADYDQVYYQNQVVSFEVTGLPSLDTVVGAVYYGVQVCDADLQAQSEWFDTGAYLQGEAQEETVTFSARVSTGDMITETPQLRFGTVDSEGIFTPLALAEPVPFSSSDSNYPVYLNINFANIGLAPGVQGRDLALEWDLRALVDPEFTKPGVGAVRFDGEVNLLSETSRAQWQYLKELDFAPGQLTLNSERLSFLVQETAQVDLQSVGLQDFLEVQLTDEQGQVLSSPWQYVDDSSLYYDSETDSLSFVLRFLEGYEQKVTYEARGIDYDATETGDGAEQVNQVSAEHIGQYTLYPEASDYDLFQFEAVAGGRYLLQATALSYDIDPELYVLEDLNEALQGQPFEFLAYNDDYKEFGSDPSSQVRFTAPTTGTYYLLVKDILEGMGHYELEIKQISDYAGPVIKGFSHLEQVVGERTELVLLGQNFTEAAVVKLEDAEGLQFLYTPIAQGPNELTIDLSDVGPGEYKIHVVNSLDQWTWEGLPFVVYAEAPQTPPQLVADLTENQVGKALELTYTPEELWQQALQYVTVNEYIVPQANYGLEPGKLILNADNFSEAGVYKIAVTATGYATAVIEQAVEAAPLDLGGSGGGSSSSSSSSTSMEATPVATTQYSGELLQALAATNGSVKVETETGAYELPAAELNIAELAGQMGVPVDQLNIKVTIAPVAEGTQQAITEFTAQNGLTQVGPIVEYKVEAVAGEVVQEIAGFSGYVTRYINLDGVVDPSTTVGVYLTEAGTLAPVPTQFLVTEDGMVAVLKRTGNSIYTLISFRKTFKDIQGHWAQKDIEALAGKLIITGKDQHHFAPDAQLSRAEMTALLVRALGLSTAEQNESSFKDVAVGAWYYGTVQAARAAGLVQGYEDGSFRPDGFVTRQEVELMLARGLRLAGVEAAATTGLERAKQSATRAEAAVMLKRILVQAKFYFEE